AAGPATTSSQGRRLRGTEPADLVDPADHVTTGRGCLCIAEGADRLAVAEKLERFLESLEVFWAHEHRYRPAVARDHHPLVVALHTVDKVGQVVPHIAERLRRHDHNRATTAGSRWQGDLRAVSGSPFSITVAHQAGAAVALVLEV